MGGGLSRPGLPLEVRTGLQAHRGSSDPPWSCVPGCWVFPGAPGLGWAWLWLVSELPIALLLRVWKDKAAGRATGRGGKALDALNPPLLQSDLLFYS